MGGLGGEANPLVLDHFSCNVKHLPQGAVVCGRLMRTALRWVSQGVDGQSLLLEKSTVSYTFGVKPKWGIAMGIACRSRVSVGLRWSLAASFACNGSESLIGIQEKVFFIRFLSMSLFGRNIFFFLSSCQKLY